MGFKDVLLNVFTLGAHGRVQNAVSDYESLLEDFNNLQEEHEEKRKETNKVLEDMIEVKRRAVIAVKKTQSILNNLSIKQRDFVDEQIGEKSYSLDKINASITIADSVVSTTKGAVAGVSTALGTWALVGTYGVASTGTAISALSGVAATNATLAWLGGGAIAAGGGGMAAGTAVLGGLVAIPVIAVTGLFQHLAANKKIAELKKEEVKIVNLMGKIKKNLVQLDAIKMRSNELVESISKSLEAYEFEYKKALSKIYPFGVFSRLIKSIRKKVFKMDYFSKKDYSHIKDIGLTVGYILKMVDSPVL